MSKQLCFRPEDVPVDGRDVDVTLEPAWFAGVLGQADVAGAEPTHVTGRLEVAGNKIVFRGRLETGWHFECSRCAAEAEAPVVATFAHVFVPRDEHSRDAVSDDGMTWFDGPTFDAEPVVREELVLALPEYPLCREDCKGLCNRCGADLNEGPCACEPVTDPRWAKLKGLKIQ